MEKPYGQKSRLVIREIPSAIISKPNYSKSLQFLPTLEHFQYRFTLPPYLIFDWQEIQMVDPTRPSPKNFTK